MKIVKTVLSLKTLKPIWTNNSTNWQTGKLACREGINEKWINNS